VIDESIIREAAKRLKIDAALNNPPWPFPARGTNGKTAAISRRTGQCSD